MEAGIERLPAMTYPLRHCERSEAISHPFVIASVSEAISNLDCRVAGAPRNDRKRGAPRNDGKWVFSCVKENEGSAQ